MGFIQYRSIPTIALLEVFEVLQRGKRNIKLLKISKGLYIGLRVSYLHFYWIIMCSTLFTRYVGEVHVCVYL